MENRIKNIIKEEIDKFMAADRFKKDFEYLEPFNYVGHFVKDGHDKWIFSLSYKKNELIVRVTKKGDDWYFEIESKGRNNHAIVEWGPFSDYDEFKKQITDKLHNNLQFSTGNLKNDREDAYNDDMYIRIEELMKKSDVVDSLHDGNLEDVKEFCRLVKSFRGLNKKDFIDSIRDEFDDVKGIANILNKIPQIDYYKKLEKFQGYQEF